MIETFTTTGTSATGIPLKATITDTRVSSGDTASLVDETQFLELRKGRSDHARIEPMVACEATLSVLRTAPVEQLTDATETEVEFSLTREDTSAEVLRGYFVPRRYRDRPFLPYDDVVRLTFDEGLPTLKGMSFGDLSLTDRYQVRIITVIREILGTLYDSPLPIEVGMGWWPNSSLTQSDLPLQYTWLDPDNFRQERPDGDEWQSQFQVLKSIFQAFGFVCRQVRRDGQLVWHVRQPYAVSGDGSIPLWSVSASGTITSEGAVNLSKDLTTKINDGEIQPEHSRTFMEGRESVTVTHEHASGVDYIREGGFEEMGRYWNNVAAGASFNSHSSHPETPDGQPENQIVVRMAYDSDNASGGVNIELEQTSNIVRPEPRDSLRFSLNAWHSQTALLACEITNGNAQLAVTTADVQFGASPGDVQVLVSPLEDTVYEGQVLPVYEQGSDPPLFVTIRTHFRVTETAEAGSTSVRGELDAQVQQGDLLGFPTMNATSSVENFPLDHFVRESEREQWSKVQVEFSATNENGNRLQSRQMYVGMGFRRRERNDGILQFFFDNLSLEAFRDGREMTSTTLAAETSASGEEDEITTRIGSGPDEGSISRIFGQGIYDHRFPVLSCDKSTNQVVVEGDARGALEAGIRIVKHEINGGEYNVTGSVTYDSASDTTTLDDVLGTRQLQDFGEQGYAVAGLQSEFSAFEWGNSATASTFYPLGQLLARQRLRYYRTQSTQYEIDTIPPDDPLFFHGHEVVLINGEAHTISSLTSRPSSAERPITALENTDDGIP